MSFALTTGQQQLLRETWRANAAGADWTWGTLPQRAEALALVQLGFLTRTKDGFTLTERGRVCAEVLL